MPEENKSATLKDRLLDRGAGGRQFISGSSSRKKTYTVLDYDENSGKLSVKYNDDRKAALDLKTHANDLETATELKEGEFYRTASGSKNYVLFCGKEKLIDVDGKELDRTKLMGLIHIENPADYVSSLRQESQRSQRCAYFIAGQLERKLIGSEPDLDDLPELDIPDLEVPEPAAPDFDSIIESELAPEVPDLEVPEPEYPLDEDKQLNASKEEAEALKEIKGDTSLEDSFGTRILDVPSGSDDPNFDSFGSGSGLLDLSLQLDETSLGGILDEIYAPEEQRGETPDNDSLGGILDDTGTDGGFLEELDKLTTPEVDPNLESYELPRIIYSPEDSVFGNPTEKRRGLFRRIREWYQTKRQ